HSIFNHVKTSLAHNEYASQIMDAYIGILRYLFVNGRVKQPMVLLAEELNFIRKMLFLNRVAVPNGVGVVLDVAPRLVAREISQLLFGTLVENAFRYGDQHDPRHPIRIEVS